MVPGCKLRKMPQSKPVPEKKYASGKSVLLEFLNATKQYPWLLAMALVGIVSIQIAYVLSPIYLSQFITLLSTSTPSAENAALLLSPLVLYAAFELAAWVAQRIEMWGGIHLAPKVMTNLTNRAFEHLMRHSYQFFTSSFSGSLTRKVSRFGRTYDQFYDSITLSILPAALYIAGIIVVLFTRSALLAGALALWVVVFVALQWALVRWQQPLRTKRAEEDTGLTGAIADSVSNQSTTQLFSGSRHEGNLINVAVKKYQIALTRVWVSEWWIFGLLGLLSIGINILLLWIALVYWQQGLLAVGDFVLIQAYLFRVMNYVWSLGREFRSISTSIADAAEMVHIIQMPYDIKDKKGAKRLRVDTGEVWFDDVTFNFHKGTPILHQFNLTIAGGERVALVGPSGAGKSTVTKLLLRLYDVDKGEIKIDKQDIAKVTQDTLRDAIAFVPQEPILFHRTLMENIRYGYRDATDERVIEAAKKAHCHEFISRLPLGYDTFVGERGIKLSGGERQRVAIARAILKDAPILVLDEATSSLDSESEALIQDALNVLMEGKTVIVIAHRLSTIMKMDRIIVMEAGAVVAQGTHLQLINERGLYQKLWSIQAGGFLGGSEDDETVVNADEAGAEEDSAGLADRLAEEEK